MQQRHYEYIIDLHEYVIGVSSFVIENETTTIVAIFIRRFHPCGQGLFFGCRFQSSGRLWASVSGFVALVSTLHQSKF